MQAAAAARPRCSRAVPARGLALPRPVLKMRSPQPALPSLHMSAGRNFSRCARAGTNAPATGRCGVRPHESPRAPRRAGRCRCRRAGSSPCRRAGSRPFGSCRGPGCPWWRRNPRPVSSLPRRDSPAGLPSNPLEHQEWDADAAAAVGGVLPEMIVSKMNAMSSARPNHPRPAMIQNQT